ncbi:MAG: hypothetical protein NVSMB9_05020 [Isosphaeraceae bacterium]
MKTPRTHARTRRAVAVLILTCAGLSSLAGCDPRTLFYFLQPFEPTIPAPGPSLASKRVVVVTHAVSNAMGEFQSLDRDLGREVASNLRAKVKKIDVVEPDKVWNWVEGHPNWTDPAELARAFEADVVIFLEIEGFSVQNQGDLNVLQGAAKTHIQVTSMVYPTNSKGKPIKDQPREAKTIYNEYCDTEFPVRGPIPADSGVSRGAFKSKFLKVVAAEISWHFVEHAPDDNIQDVKFNNK